MECCCADLGECTDGPPRPVPLRCIEDLIARVQRPITSTMMLCPRHWAFVTSIPKRCIKCHKKKTGLRPASKLILHAHPNDKICRTCQDKVKNPCESTSPTVPSPHQVLLMAGQKQMFLNLLNEPYFVMPLLSDWCEEIFRENKRWKYIYRALSERVENKIVLLRAMTPDKKCRNVVGAVVLGPHDPDAPTDSKIGWSDQRPFGHPIEAMAKFSEYRSFSMTTYANGYPKELTPKQIRDYAKCALLSVWTTT